MPYPRHYLGIIGGVLRQDANSTVVDEWQCTIKIGNVSGLPTAGELVPDDYITNQLRPAIETWMADSSGPWSTFSELQYVKFNEIGTDGRYVDQTTTHRYDYPAGSTHRGALAPGTYDPAAALAITWTTSHQRGPAHKGRMFVPVPNVAPNGFGRLPKARCDAIAVSAGTFIQALQVSGVNTESHGAVVVSNRGATGAALEIQGVLVGDVLDHQLRRRNAMVETYSSHTI